MSPDLNAICDIVEKVTDRRLDRSQVTENTSYLADLGLTSIQTVDLIMKLEDRFGIEVEDTDLVKIRTIGQTLAYLKARTGTA